MAPCLVVAKARAEARAAAQGLGPSRGLGAPGAWGSIARGPGPEARGQGLGPTDPGRRARGPDTLQGPDWIKGQVRLG